MTGREEEIYCAECECTDITKTQEDYSFRYGVDGPDQVELTVEIPVYTCNNKDCGYKWWNWEASEIMDAYVEQYIQEQQQKNK